LFRQSSLIASPPTVWIRLW